MIFKNHRDDDVEVNQETFKEIIRVGIAGTGLTQVALNDGTFPWLKATQSEILKAVGSRQT